MEESMKYTHREAVEYGKRMGLPTSFPEKTYTHWSLLNRATGRTTRLLTHAMELAASGKKVVIVGATSSHARMLHSQYWNMTLKHPQETEILANTSYCDIHHPRLSWAPPKAPFYEGMSDAVILIDHYAIGRAFEELFDRYHQFDGN